MSVEWSPDRRRELTLSHTEIEVEPETRIVFVNPPVLGGTALYEPLGIEVVAGKLKEEMGDLVDVGLIDAQIGNMPASGKGGAARAVRLEHPDGVGISVHQYGWNWVKEFLRDFYDEYGKQIDKVPRVGLGGTWVTLLPREYYAEILRQFPFVFLVRGEGEEAFAGAVKRIRQGETLDGVSNLVHLDTKGEVKIEDYQPANLDNYSVPHRLGLRALLDKGVIPRAEWGRGCRHAAEEEACKFCPRPEIEDPRVVPELKRLEDLGIIVTVFGKREFQVTDEETLDFFPELRSMAEALIEIKEADPLFEVAFSLSTRPDRVLELEDWDRQRVIELEKKLAASELEKTSTLDLLIQAGLKKIALGGEGGSDFYLKLLGKGQTVEEVVRAMDIVLEKKRDLELLMIPLHYRMTVEDLKNNIAFLGEEERYQYVSWVLNELEVYPRSTEEKIAKSRKLIMGKLDLNSLRYEVEYQDSKVRRVVSAVREWVGKRGEGSYFDLYYALKGLVRTKVAPETEMEKEIVEFQKRFRERDFKFLKAITNLVDEGKDDADLRVEIQHQKEERRASVDNLRERMEEDERVDPRGILYGELVKFIESEREGMPRIKLGEAAVIVDRDDNVWLVEKSHPAFRGTRLELLAGMVWEGEEGAGRTIKREMWEEARIDGVSIGPEMPAIRIPNHVDTRGKRYDLLLLLPFMVFVEDGVELKLADRELVRVVKVPIKDFRQRVEEMGYVVDEAVARVIDQLDQGFLTYLRQKSRQG